MLVNHGLICEENSGQGGTRTSLSTKPGRPTKNWPSEDAAHVLSSPSLYIAV